MPAPTISHPIPDIFRFEVTEPQSGQRLDRFLAASLPEISRSRLKQLIDAGETTVDGLVRTSPSYRVKSGQAIVLTLPLAVDPTPQAQDLPLTVLYEDRDLIVIDKAAGLVVHPAPGNPDNTLVNALIAHCGESLSGIGGIRRPGIVHRLDKDTSGVMVAAKTDPAHTGLQQLFQSHDIDRHYKAVVWGSLAQSGEIQTLIGRDPRNRKKMSATVARGRDAVTRYRILERFGALATMLDCRLETGRTHQIRVHMTHLGTPILGDNLYGRARRLTPKLQHTAAGQCISGLARQALHAYRLGFRHPLSGENLNFETPLPDDMENVRSALQELTQNQNP